jgi:hypothetical protein
MREEETAAMWSRQAATVTTVLAAVGLLVSLAAAWSRLDPGPTVRVAEPGPAAPAPPSPVTRADAVAGRGAEAAPPFPVRVTMPSTRVAAPVRPVGVATDGEMELPPDPRVLGWYQFGAAPGVAPGGSVVLAGHLDSERFGLGPLVRLRDLERGDVVSLRLSDGRTRTYGVVSLERFDRESLPERLFSRTGPERLRIITCGGEYDAKAGGYQQNLVVTATPTAPPP